MNPTCIGIGIGENTALLIRDGNQAECKGTGMVTIIDGKNIGHTNVAYAEKNVPLSVEGLVVHILSRGTRFLLRERRFVASVKDKRMERATRAKSDKQQQTGKPPKKRT